MPIKYLKITATLTITVMAFCGCSKIEDGSIKPPLVYRIDIQQGNVVDQSMMNKLRVGMDKKQVRFILGTPLLMDPFHDERWEYLYTYQEGGEGRQKRHITLFFEDEKLAYVKGDIKVTNIPTQPDETNSEKSVIVPENISNKTLLERWLSDKPELPETKSAEETDEKTDQEKAEDRALVDEDKQFPDETSSESAQETSPEAVDDKTEPAEEVAGEKKGGFFSGLWNKLSGGDDDAPPADAEVLQPDKAEDQAINKDEQLPDETSSESAQETSPEAVDDKTEPAKEVAGEKKGGFFSKLWDKLSGGNDDAPPANAEVLQPDLENK